MCVQECLVYLIQVLTMLYTSNQRRRLLKKLLTLVKFFTIQYTIESAQEDAYSNSVVHNTGYIVWAQEFAAYRHAIFHYIVHFELAHLMYAGGCL